MKIDVFEEGKRSEYVIEGLGRRLGRPWGDLGASCDDLGAVLVALERPGRPLTISRADCGAKGGLRVYDYWGPAAPGAPRIRFIIG